MRETEKPNTAVLPRDGVAPDVWTGVAPAGKRCPRLTHDWTVCAVATDPLGGEVRLVVVGDPAEPMAIAPLVVRPGSLARHEFVANTDGAVEIAVQDDAALPALARALVALPGEVNLFAYPAQSRLLGHIEAAARGRAVVVREPQAMPSAPYIELDESWRAPESHLTAKMAQSIRRRERRLSELGEVRVAFIEPAEDEVDALLDLVVLVEAMGWKYRAGTALVEDQPQHAFLRAYAKTVARRGDLHITFLHLDDEPLAMSIGEITDNTYWAHKTGYDETYARYGPGILLQYHLIRHLAERRLARIDFRGKADAFKRAWTDKSVPTVALRLYPYTWRGMAAWAVDTARTRLAALSGQARAGGPRPSGGGALPPGETAHAPD